MPLGGNLGLKKLWLAREPQQEGWACEGLRIYKAESPDLYPSDQARRHQMRWLRQGDGNRFDQFRQVFLAMDRLVRKKNRRQEEGCSNSHQQLGETPVFVPSVPHQHSGRSGCGS